MKTPAPGPAVWRRWFRNAGAFLVVSALAFPALAATYYVDPDNGNGSNSGASSAAPVKTLAKARQLPYAGDSLLFKAGTGINLDNTSYVTLRDLEVSNCKTPDWMQSPDVVRSGITGAASKGGAVKGILLQHLYVHDLGAWPLSDDPDDLWFMGWGVDCVAERSTDLALASRVGIANNRAAANGVLQVQDVQNNDPSGAAYYRWRCQP
jgi:hypothetical protein